MQKLSFIYFTVCILKAQNRNFSGTDVPELRRSVKKKKAKGLPKTFFTKNIIQSIALFILA